jgi:hypothetical protein
VEKVVLIVRTVVRFNDANRRASLKTLNAAPAALPMGPLPPGEGEGALSAMTFSTLSEGSLPPSSPSSKDRRASAALSLELTVVELSATPGSNKMTSARIEALAQYQQLPHTAQFQRDRKQINSTHSVTFT